MRHRRRADQELTMRILHVAALMMSVILTGCAGQPLLGSYNTPQTACCKSIGAVSFTLVALGQETEFNVKPDSQTLEFSGMRKHIVAIKIPDGVSVTALQVKTFLSTGFLPNATAVYPDFHFFDEKLAPLATASPDDFQPVGGFWRSGLTGRVVVPSKTRFLIAMPSEGHRRSVVYSENRTPYVVRPAALGDFTIRLFGQ